MTFETNLVHYRSLNKLRTTEHEDGLREIARIVRTGGASPIFLHLIADLMDPDKGYDLLGVKLVVKRKEGGKPKSLRTSKDADLERFLELHIVIFERNYDFVVATAKKKFGVGKTKCDNALKKVRAVHTRDPEYAEARRETVRLLRDQGDPDYQPL